MWYEILPSFGIVVAAMALPHFSAFVINKAICGNSYRRRLLETEDMLQYLRDWTLTGNPYKINGLDAIPDEDN
ncbi:uncharacterized protein LOC108737311 [Agrilus planipennis]|uniref:Uncharacterized protein LOC108737311 n=1 Tax=Agrilus planipennis TaxID=224129 RepID=A0A1W4WZL3_AGRPL|nr:uncharacterized protein LOC108737311 [Agrilus planipennis]